MTTQTSSAPSASTSLNLAASASGKSNRVDKNEIVNDNHYDENDSAITPAKRIRISHDQNLVSSRRNISSDSGGNPTAVTPAPSSLSYVSANAPQTPMTCPKAIESLLLEKAGYDCKVHKTTPKRQDYITWDEYFMATAVLSSFRSKDPSRPSGACIVDSKNRIIGTGYNGFPAGCSDDCLPWAKNNTHFNDQNKDSVESKPEKLPLLHTSTPYMVHAEINSILNKCAPDCSGARLYTQRFPCNECAKIIIQAGISEIVYMDDGDDEKQYTEDELQSFKASYLMLSIAGVRMRLYKSERSHVHLDFTTAMKDSPKPEQQEGTHRNSCNCCHYSHAEQYRDLLLKEAKYDPLKPRGATKRVDALSWDDYFMSMAFLTAQRSKDPNTQVGACIVDANKRICGLGYNGFPAGCSDDILPWARQAPSNNPLHMKYIFVCHAETNAILNKGSADLRGATLYVALFPCNECAKVIIQAGIKEVVYMSDKYRDLEVFRASRILLNMSNVKTRQYTPNIPEIHIPLGNNALNTND